MWLVACAPEEPVWSFTATEIDAIDAVNDVRAAEGLEPLEAATEIGEVSRKHSKDMLSGQVAFGHDGFDARADALAITLPWLSVGENVATSTGFSDPVGVAVEGWINSPPHYENMLGEWTHTGIGAANHDTTWYFTQIFVLVESP